MNEQAILGHKVMLWICILADAGLSGFLSFYLTRSWKRRMVTFATAYGSIDFPRDEKPLGYWVTFCGYWMLNFICFGGGVRLIYKLSHGA